MKQGLKLVSQKVMMLTLASLFALQPAMVAAQTPPADQLEHIVSRCSSVQISLQQLQKRDAVARINRGRAYDQQINQISAMNSRLAFNKVSIPELVPLTGELQQRIDRFRSVTDKEYLERLITLARFDCKAKPAEFYQQLVVVREDRNKVAAEIAKIEELITQYRDVLAVYQAQLKATEEAGDV